MTKIVTSFTAITTAFLLTAVVPSIEAISAPNQRGPSSGPASPAPVKDKAKDVVGTEAQDQEKIKQDKEAFAKGNILDGGTWDTETEDAYKKNKLNEAQALKDAPPGETGKIAKEDVKTKKEVRAADEKAATSEAAGDSKLPNAQQAKDKN